MKRPTYRIVAGLRMPCGFPPAGLHSALQFEPRPTDVIVATYPKCGTTWTQHIIYMLYHNGNSVGPGESIRSLCPHIDETGSEAIEELPDPRLLKTHLPLTMFPYRKETKYIYVARNPFDCAVSFFHHTQGFVKHYDFADGTFDDFFEVFIRGEVDFGDYFEHLLSWLAVAENDNVFFITYENLHANLASEVVRLAQFLGGEALATAQDEDALARIVAAASFRSMAKDQLRWASKRPDGMTEFVRKGIVGDWRNHFSAEQLARLLQRAEEKFAASGVLDWWHDEIAEIKAAI